MNTPVSGRRRWPRVLALIGVAVVLLAVAAATFLLSYDGIHVIALGAGVPDQLARYYPGLLDAALVIACLAAVMLRDGRWWARGYAWLAIVVIAVAGGGANAVHAMNVALPHRQTAGAVAAAPWVLLLLSFSLWLTALRQSRGRRGTAPSAAPEGEAPSGNLPEIPAEEDVPVSGQVWPRDYWDADETEAEAEVEAETETESAAESPAAVPAESPEEVHHLNRPRSLPAPPEGNA